MIISMVKNKVIKNLKTKHCDKVESVTENETPDIVISDISSNLGYKEFIKMVDNFEQPYREVFVMRNINSLNVGKISKMLNLPYRTVETSIFRARKKLKERLEEMHNECSN